MFLASKSAERGATFRTERKRKRCDTFEQDVKQEDD